MTDKPANITLFTKQLIHNPLLDRKQMIVEIIHTDKVNVSKTAIKEKLATMFKCDPGCVSVFGIKFKFGGGRSSGFAMIYDSIDARKKNDQKKLLRRDDLIAKTKKVGRKQGKEIKSRVKRVRGTKKNAIKAGKGGKKKK